MVPRKHPKQDNSGRGSRMSKGCGKERWHVVAWSLLVAHVEVDYTIAIAERSLAKSIKRCLGKENLAKAMHSFFDPCSKHAERMQCIRSRNFTSSLRNCNCFFALFDPTSADLNAIPTCSEAGQRMPPSVSSKVDLANMLAECVWGLQQNGPEQLH